MNQNTEPYKVKNPLRECVRCRKAFVTDTLNVRYCSSECRRYDHENKIFRDDDGNIIAGRMRDKVSEEYSIKKTSLRSINDDVSDLSQIECVSHFSLAHTEIIFVDDNGNQYEYDGVCIHEGKLKISIKSTK